MPVEASTEIISSLFNGASDMIEDMVYARSEANREKTKEVAELEARVKERYGTQALIDMDDYVNAITNRHIDQLDTAFVAGFQLATKLLVAGLSEGKSADEM